MAEYVISRFEEAHKALCNYDLAQGLYDAGEIMDGVLLTLHGDEHRARRLAEFKIFSRSFFRFYEQERFPLTIEETLAPFLAMGGCDLVDFNYRVTMNLTADFAGIDRPDRTEDETADLLKLVRKFSEGATIAHSTRSHDDVNREVREAMVLFKERFLLPSIARRKSLLEDYQNGKISDEDLPRDVVMALLRNEEKLNLSEDVFHREIAFYLQAGSHSTGNSMTHALHNIFMYCEKYPETWERLLSDPLFLQRCVHESLRLHPASPVAWRKPVCPFHLEQANATLSPDDRVVIDLHEANREREIFGEDADEFNPFRNLPKNVLPFGLTFGIGVHACLGRDLDGGVVQRADTDPDNHQYGIVTLLVRRLLEAGARPDPVKRPKQDPSTARKTWGEYPILFTSKTAKDVRK